MADSSETTGEVTTIHTTSEELAIQMNVYVFNALHTDIILRENTCSAEFNYLVVWHRSPVLVGS